MNTWYEYIREGFFTGLQAAVGLSVVLLVIFFALCTVFAVGVAYLAVFQKYKQKLQRRRKP